MPIPLEILSNLSALYTICMLKILKHVPPNWIYALNSRLDYLPQSILWEPLKFNMFKTVLLTFPLTLVFLAFLTISVDGNPIHVVAVAILDSHTSLLVIDRACHL